jgi:hypothetical protein
MAKRQSNTAARSLILSHRSGRASRLSRIGYGRRLLDEVQALSDAHPTSTGVGLDTEKPSNVSFYEHCGYRVTGKTNLKHVDIWCMFRENGA